MIFNFLFWFGSWWLCELHIFINSCMMNMFAFFWAVMIWWSPCWSFHLEKIIFILLDGARWEILPLSLRQTMILHQIVVLTYQQLLAKDFLVHYLWVVGLLEILLELLLNIVCRRGLLLYNEHCRIRLISCNQWVNQIQVCKGQRSSDGVLSDQCDPWQDLGFSCRDMVVLHCPVLFVVQYL